MMAEPSSSILFRINLKRRTTSSQSAESYNSGRSTSLQRRHSLYQADYEQDSDEPVMECDRALADRLDGIEIAFERTKAWSRYCKELTTFVKTRLSHEYEHSKKVTTLVESTRQAMNDDFLPMRDLFFKSFDYENEQLLKIRETQEHLNDRFIKSLESRRTEHESARRQLKAEWTKQVKSLQDAEAEHKKAQQNLAVREDGLKKAKESALRSEGLSSPGISSSSDPLKRRKDMEKKRKNEDEALFKREEALQQVRNLEAEVRRKRRIVEKCKEKTIERLRELIYQCDQTTKACTQHYFKALTSLWSSVPGRLQELADATLDYQPGQEYMSFLDSLPPHRANSQHSLLRSDRSIDDLSSHGEGSSLTAYRRNALNPDDHEALPDKRRHKKTSSAGRLFDAGELDDVALSHTFQRSSRPAKCAQCETLSILFTVSCSKCGLNWHRTCFPKVGITCGQSSKNPADRRMSMFGVSLQKQLEDQQREIPLILEEVIHEIQHRGLRVKGIYRTCGVKSKIEEICELFERHTGEGQVPLDHVHPMNLASVVKLYLRKLPEPLMTYDLYPEWVGYGTRAPREPEDSHVDELRTLINKLPSANYETLKFLLLHINRVSWFSDTNLMTPSNLSTVIAPSLCWAPHTQEANACIADTQQVNRTVEVMITYAYTIFNVDKTADWQLFFSKYSVDEPNKPEDPVGDIEEGDIEDDDDDDELKDEDIDDDQIFLPQPPTPDILKNTRKTNGEFSSEDAQTSRWVDNSSEDSQPTRSQPTRIRSRDKRRSYTTSILIAGTPSSMTEPRRLGNPQKSTEENTAIVSGDVTVEVSEGQLYVGEITSSTSTPRRGGEGRGGLVRQQSDNDFSSQNYGSSSGYTSTVDCARAVSDSQPNISSHGDLFPGTESDVSYV